MTLGSPDLFRSNYSHAPIFKCGLTGIQPTASKEQVQDAMDKYRPVHIAFTGNPSHLNFGKGQVPSPALDPFHAFHHHSSITGLPGIDKAC